jgi:UDP-N-acetylmuramoyl-tripeptide--D-alanyl-D-alanine ligase
MSFKAFSKRWRMGNLVEYSLYQLKDRMNGEILQGPPSLSFHKFNIDSRLSEPGELFFALVAERNGHDFITHAADKGASGAVISQKIIPPFDDFALIKVPNTLEALQTLAQNTLSEHPVKVVGITGSIGKTTTKEFTSALIAKRFKVLKSEGNFNNHLGLPLSVLRLREEHEIAVLEMGMSHPGEIQQLTQIAPPDVAVITNVQPVHLEFLKTIANVADAKKEILDGMKPNGTAILNGDDPWVNKISSAWKGDKVFFGTAKSWDISAQNIRKTGIDGMSFELNYGGKKGEVVLPSFFDSTLFNFLAAAAVAFTFSVPIGDIQELSTRVKPTAKRGTVFLLENDQVLIDDSYNSNPSALKVTLQSVGGLSAKRKIAVLGDMLELGEESRRYHVTAGQEVVKNGFDLLVTVGPLSKHMAEGARTSGMPENCVYSFEDSQEAAKTLGGLLDRGDLILVKGSRGIQMETIVEQLREKG